MTPVSLSKNIFSSWGGLLIRLIINLFFIPFITSTLGQDRYGIWVICFQIISYFSFAEFGIDKALLRFIPKFLARNDDKEVNSTLNTATLIYLLSGCLIIGLTQLFAEPILQLFKTPIPALTLEGTMALKVIGIYLAIRFWLSPFGGSLGSFQRFDLAAVLQLGEDIVRTLLMVWVLSSGGGLIELAWVITGASTIRLLVGRLVLRRLYPQARLSVKAISRGKAQMLFGYGGISLAITILLALIYSSEAPLLGALISTGAAGIYATAAQLILYMRHIVNSIGSPLTAALSGYESKGDKTRISDTYLMSLRMASLVSFLSASGIFIFSNDFVRLWLEPGFYQSGEIMRILAIGAAVFVPQIVGNSLLFGLEKHRYLLTVLAIEAALKLSLAWLLIGKYGILGMALASTVPQLILYTTLYPAMIARVLETSYRKMLLAVFVPGGLIALVVLPLSWVIKVLLPPQSWSIFIVDVTIVTLAASVCGYYYLSPNERIRVRGWLTFK